MQSPPPASFPRPMAAQHYIKLIGFRGLLRVDAKRKASVKGILKTVHKLLVHDQGKLPALLVGITFAVFLMVMMTSMFSGSSAALLPPSSTSALWDPAVTTPAHIMPLPDYR